MSRFRLVATALLVALCAGFYSCGGDNDETPLNNDDNSNISNENGNSVIVGTTAMVQLKKVGALSTLISDNVKFNITDLRIMGDINGDDIALIREMAGADVKGNETNGKLANLNLSNANLVNGGIYYTGITQEVSSSNELWQYMFYKCGSLTSIVLPNNIAHIGAFALSYSGITSFTIPNNIQTIGNEAFISCHKLTSVKIGSGVSSMSETAFEGCANLDEFVVIDNKGAYSTQDGILYNRSKTKVVRCPLNKRGIINLPASIGTIGDYAFSSCTGITSIYITETGTIGSCAFSNCTNLESIHIADRWNTVTFIMDYAFENCVKLSSITIPACSKVWGEAFVGCIGMKEIHLKWGYLNSSDLGFLYRLNKDCKIFIPRGHLGTYMKYWTDIDRLVEE